MINRIKIIKMLRRYIKLFFTCFRCSLINTLEYKLNFFFAGMFELVWMIMYIVFFNVIFMNTSSIAGWTKNEILLLVFLGGLMDAVFTFLVVGSIAELPYHVNQGTLDFILLKPINKKFYLSFRRFIIPQIFNIILILAGVIYYFIKLNLTISFTNMLTFIILSINGFLIIYNIIFIIMSLSFWVVRMDVISALGSELITIGNKPREIYPSLLQKIFTYIIPLFLAFNYPIMSITNRLQTFDIILPIILTIILSYISKIVLKAGLKRYSSASS